LIQFINFNKQNSKKGDTHRGATKTRKRERGAFAKVAPANRKGLTTSFERSQIIPQKPRA